VIFFYCLCLFSVVVFGQPPKQISFGQLSVNEGLSQNSVVSIAQDSIGYLWFATQDGLNKYDGNEFRYYQKFFEDITKESYSKLGKIYVDRKRDLYIITKDEVLEKYYIEVDSFRKINRFQKVSTVYQDTYQNTWVGSYGNGLYVFNDKDTIQVFKGLDIIKGVSSISENQNRIIVLASENVFELDPITFKYKNIPFASNSQNTVNFSSSANGINNTLWIGSHQNGLYQISANGTSLESFSGFNIANQLPTNLNIQFLLFDSKDRLWVCTYGNGVYLLDFKHQVISQFIVQQSNPKALHYNDVLCAYEDFTGTVWLGTDGAGLSYYDENLTKFSSITNASIPDEADVGVTRAIAVDVNGAFWIGTSGKGLTYYNPNENKYKSYKYDLRDKNSINSDRVMSLLSESNRLWVGFQDEGLAIIQNGIVSRFTSETTPKLNAFTVWCIFKDSNSRYWLGTRDSGLIQFDSNMGVVKQYTYDKNNTKGLSSNNIRTIIEGQAGQLWIGTENNGLHKFLIDKESFLHYPNKEIANVKSLYFDSENYLIWVGTNGNGLQAFDPKNETIKGFTLMDGLPNNVIYAILPDAKNNLWLSSNRGISRFSRNKDTIKSTIINYDTYDGLQAMEFNTGASFKGQDGTLYFGGLNGVNWFRPDELSNNPVPPKTIISKLEVFDQEINIGDHSKFTYKQNTLTFNFVSLHFSQPERNKYKYILADYDQTWSKEKTSNYARYTNLPAGDYVFKVTSSNYDGVWDESPANYSFTIAPPWFLTLWAKFAYVLGIFIVLYLVYKYLKWRWKMQVQLQLKHRETERLKKLDELKSKLYTNISHEFRTPLTLISGPIQQLISKSSIAKEDKKVLNLIETSSQRMLRLVNQLLDLSKLETGSVQLRVSQHNLAPLLEQVYEAFKHKANDKKIIIKTAFDYKENAWFDKDFLEKILFNLISNAIKYAPENSEIIFATSRNGEFLEIEVENENESVPIEMLSKLFDRFYQLDKSVEGVGIGLSLIKELVGQCNGSVKVEKKSLKTISFKVSIPIEKEKYNANSLVIDPVTFNFEQRKSDSFLMDSEEVPIVLIVEDNEEVRKYMASILNDSFMVLEAKDGLEGINTAINDVPDLIISDVMMPNKDGIELCNTLKEDTRTCHIPIILVTAKADIESEIKGLKSKADDYIPKPFNSEVIRQKVINSIEGRRELRKRYKQNVYLHPKDIAVVSLDERFLESVQELINSKFMDTGFTAEDFSKEIGLSRMQLHRKIKALTGLNTSEFIRSQRLKSATKLLETSDLTISEIAYSVGFNTPSYFAKCFKGAYNCTPKEYNDK